MEYRTARAKWVDRCTFILVWLNILAFIAGAAFLHGDALSGYSQGGHFFLGWKGTFFEVSRPVWEYSFWHALSVLLGLLLVMIERFIFEKRGELRYK